MSDAIRVLLVDDEEDFTEAVGFWLTSRGHTVSKARDGEQALNYLYRREEYERRPGGDPILILLDLKMPKVNGIEVLKEMKADIRLRNIPVVVVTSSRENPDIRKCYELGVNAYVVKPVDFREFTEAIRNVGLFWVLINQLPEKA